jgi:WD domain, G-beta repeat
LPANSALFLVVRAQEQERAAAAWHLAKCIDNVKESAPRNMDSPEHEFCLRAAATGEAADELPSVVALQIDRVIGLSPPAGAAAIAASPIDPDLLLWPAGAFAVVFSTSRQHEVELLRSCGSSRLLACTAWSPDGDVIAAGEVGEGANVLLWRRGAGGACLHELSGHKHGIAALRFVPDGALFQRMRGMHAAPGGLCRPRLLTAAGIHMRMPAMCVAITVLATNHTGKLLASAGGVYDGHLCIW